MKALITGITGFAGSHLADLLLSKGEEVAGTVYAEGIENVEHLRGRVRLIPCDIRRTEEVRRIVAEERPDRLYHLAAIASVQESLERPGKAMEVNLLGTWNLLETARALKKARVLVVSSGDVYGAGGRDDSPHREESPLRPLNPYAASKAAAEMLAYQYAKGFDLPVVRVRPFNHTGPRQRPQFVCSDIARQLVCIERGLQEPVLKVGNLTVRRDFSDVRDVVEGYWLALERGEVGEVYNLCSGRAYAIEELVELLVKRAGLDVKVHQEEVKLRSHDIPILVGDPGRFKRLTGWEVKIPIERTLQDLLDFWRSRPLTPTLSPLGRGNG